MLADPNIAGSLFTNFRPVLLAQCLWNHTSHEYVYKWENIEIQTFLSSSVCSHTLLLLNWFHALWLSALEIMCSIINQETERRKSLGRAGGSDCESSSLMNPASPSFKVASKIGICFKLALFCYHSCPQNWWEKFLYRLKVGVSKE